MKSLLILLFALGTFPGEIPAGDEIDYNPRLLHKELGILNCPDNYTVSELKLQGYPENNKPAGGKFFKVSCNDTVRFSAYIGRVKSCRTGGCSASSVNNENSDYEYFDYFILFDNENRIRSVRVYNYEATHGHEIMVKGWLNQFNGYDGTGNLRAGKEIDSISGATISVNGLVEDVREKTSILKSASIRGSYVNQTLYQLPENRFISDTFPAITRISPSAKGVSGLKNRSVL